MQGPIYNNAQTTGVSQKVAIKDALCPNCGATVDKDAARKKWLFSFLRKPVVCATCGTEYMPEEPTTLLEDFLSIGSLFLAMMVGLRFGSSLEIPGLEEFGWLIGFVVVLTCSVLVSSLILRVTFENWKVTLKSVSPTAEPVPEDLSPLISKNDDGTFTVKGRTYRSLKSAVAYLELLARTRGSKDGT